MDSTVRPQEVGFEDYGKICRSFIEITRDHDLSVTPLRVRKPVPVATEKDKETDANACDVSDASNNSNTSNAGSISDAINSNSSNAPTYRTNVTNL